MVASTTDEELDRSHSEPSVKPKADGTLGKVDKDASTAKTDSQLLVNMWFLARDRWRRSVWFGKSHDRAATLWRRIDVWLRWLLAILAALSGFSFLSEDTEIGQVLAVATALLAATNAALGPGERAGKHGKAAADYSRCESQTDWLLRLDLHPRESGGTGKSVDDLSESLKSVEEQLTVMLESAPPVRKWQRHDPSSKAFIGTNWFEPNELEARHYWWRTVQQ